MVVIIAFSMPNVSWITLATGVMQLVVQEALLRIFSPAYLSSLTEITYVGTPPPFAGADRTTDFAPALMWSCSFSALVNAPVDSITTSTLRSLQGSFVGSFCEYTGI